MIKAIALRAGTLLAVVLTMPAHAAPLMAHVVPLPAVPMSRLGGNAIRPVSRGERRTSVPVYRGVRTLADQSLTPVSRGQSRADLSPQAATAQRSQVLALRQRIKTRYHGHGKGARLAVEIP